MKKGINAWCFPAHYSLAQIFKLAKENGFEGIELNMRARIEADDLPDREPALVTGMQETDYEAVLTLSKQYELPIYSISTGLFWSLPLTDNDASVREQALSVVREMIDAATALNADTVLVVPGLVTESVSYLRAYERAQAALTQLKSYAEEKRVVIGIENVWNKFLLSPLEMRRFLDEIGSPWVRAYFDAGNVLQFSYPEHWVEALSGQIVKVHIKDFDPGIGNIHGFKPLLQGAMNWKRLMDALKDAGYDGYLTPELSPYNTNPAQLIEDTARALDYILGV